jgi:hypothetical protein
MKTFEEKFTAWLEGTLAKEEARTFEKEHPSLYKERTDLLRLRSLLKEQLGRARNYLIRTFSMRRSSVKQAGVGWVGHGWVCPGWLGVVSLRWPPASPSSWC